MPEGPSIVILKDAVQQFNGKKILHTSGNASIDKQILEGQKVLEFKSWGKHFLIVTKKINVRIHFLMFGSYSVNEQTRPDKSVRLSLKFSNGSIYFNTCSVKFIQEPLDEVYDWEADVMNENWNPAKARRKLKALKTTMVCDALLNQDIFAGVGNIIKNEVLYRVKLHPETLVENIPTRKLSVLIAEARNYSFDFLAWKKDFVLKKNWLAHTKKTCKRCNLPLTKNYCGKTKRRTFYCENCQVKY